MQDVLSRIVLGELIVRSQQEGQQVLADLKQRAQPTDETQTLALNTDTGR